MPPWSRFLQRARDALRTTSPNEAAQVAPVEALRTAPAEIAPAWPTEGPILSKRKARCDEDRTTQIYTPPSLAALTALVSTNEWPGDEVSKTARLPSEELEQLLRQQAHDEKRDSAASVSEEDEAEVDEIEVEVSSITFEELDRFRRSLANGPPEVSDAAFSPAADAVTIAPPKSLLARARSISFARHFHSAVALARRWMVVSAVRTLVFLLALRRYLP